MVPARAAAMQHAAAGTTYVAKSQTAGRGRTGAAWASAADAGLYVSCVLWPQKPWPQASLSPLMALAIAEASRSFGIAAEVKWPNDVVTARGKLCGLLLECGTSPAQIPWVILGFGFNLRPQPIAAVAQALPATDFASEQNLLGNAPQTDAFVLQQLLAYIGAAYSSWQLHGFAAHTAAFDALHTLHGEDVVARPHAQAQQSCAQGRVCGIAADGGLLVQQKDGTTHALHAGLVRRLRRDKVSQTIA